MNKAYCLSKGVIRCDPNSLFQGCVIKEAWHWAKWHYCVLFSQHSFTFLHPVLAWVWSTCLFKTIKHWQSPTHTVFQRVTMWRTSLPVPGAETNTESSRSSLRMVSSDPESWGLFVLLSERKWGWQQNVNMTNRCLHCWNLCGTHMLSRAADSGLHQESFKEVGPGVRLLSAAPPRGWNALLHSVPAGLL